PYINLQSENYDLLKEKGWLVRQKGDKDPFVFSPYWAGDASLFDITNPEAQKWLWGKIGHEISMGVDGLWIDLTEPEHPVKNGMYYLGTEEKIHNIYSTMFAKVLWEGMRTDFPAKRMFNLTRSGYAGIQRYGAATWSGDASKTWIALKLQVPMLIGTSLSGMPYFASDIGGFTNAHDRRDGLTIFSNFNGKGVLTTPEMYTRWFEFGTFSPFLRPHSGEEQYCEPFAFDKKTLEITSRYLNYRYRLIPYLYSYMYRTHSSGEALVRPLFFEFNDKQAYGRDYQYMFGESMMVAPVLDEGTTSLEVYFPALANNLYWTDLWTDEPQASGKTATVDAPLDKVPVYVKQGSVFVLGKEKKFVDQTPDDTLFVEVYPGAEGEFTLYEDDGVSTDYEKDEFATTRITTSINGGEIGVDIDAVRGAYPGLVTDRVWVFTIHLVKGYDKLTVNGEQRSSLPDPDDKGRLTIMVKSSTGQKTTVRLSGVRLKSL
ncbi:MAG TPA: TIM-barrel domain-containing protein, partial [Bacteroidales bacterium]|nr:TIM-barrel domain-containing protein [Bacteroidales bacterium]